MSDDAVVRDDPVPKHRRKPRRPYDADGTMIVPPTVGSCCAEGETTAEATCGACDHAAIVLTGGMLAGLPFPDIAMRLRFGNCGSRQITARKDMLTHYRGLREEYGSGAGGRPLPSAAGSLPPFAPSLPFRATCGSKPIRP